MAKRSKEKNRYYSRLWRLQHPQYKRDWNRKHPEKGKAYYHKNKDEILARGKIYRDKNVCKLKRFYHDYYLLHRDEKRAKHKISYKKYYQEHRTERLLKRSLQRLKRIEKETEYAKKYYSKNKESILEKGRIYRRCHKGKIRARDHRRRAKSRNVSGYYYTTEERITWRWQMWGNKCWLCGETATETDHVKPLSKGGSHWPSNLRPICKHCNRKKYTTWNGVKNIKKLKGDRNDS